MADVKTLTDEVDDYFDKSEAYSGLLPQGIYPAHITDMNVKKNKEIRSRREEGKKHVCDIYEFTYQVAPEAKDYEFKLNDDENISGVNFIGRSIRGKGIFKFKTVSPTDTKLINNAGGNKGFKYFLDAVSFKCETKVINDSRGERTVSLLPDLLLEDVKGKPVLVTVSHREWKGDDDNTRIAVEVSDTKIWESGKMTEDDIPF